MAKKTPGRFILYGIPRGSASRSGIALAVAAAFLLFAPQTHGQTYCSEPIEPSCVDVQPAPDDQMSISRCEQAVDRYEEEIEDYFACLEKRKKEIRSGMKTLREKLENLQSGNESQ